jgi:hypothetical protein
MKITVKVGKHHCISSSRSELLSKVYISTIADDPLVVVSID